MLPNVSESHECDRSVHSSPGFLKLLVFIYSLSEKAAKDLPKTWVMIAQDTVRPCFEICKGKVIALIDLFNNFNCPKVTRL